MGNSATKAKDKYNESAYARYTVRIRKDTGLYLNIQEFMRKEGTSFNFLVEKLLTEHFLRDEGE